MRSRVRAYRSRGRGVQRHPGHAAARLAGLQASLAVLAILGLVAIYFVGGIPTRQPGSDTKPGMAPAVAASPPDPEDGRSP